MSQSFLLLSNHLAWLAGSEVTDHNITDDSAARAAAEHSSVSERVAAGALVYHFTPPPPRTRIKSKSEFDYGGVGEIYEYWCPVHGSRHNIPVPVPFPLIPSPVPCQLTTPQALVTPSRVYVPESVSTGSCGALCHEQTGSRPQRDLCTVVPRVSISCP
ncbi:hypothetical protein J6590_034200 [Homalodisca vitripennis]|nr:hypothetical protein J6590_034200 [Homalodisca vitripennis]